MFLWIGFPISVGYAVWLSSFAPAFPVRPWLRSLGAIPYDVRPIQIICLLFIVGVVLDVIYIGLQKLRWERDWPFVFQFVSMIFEFFVVLGAIRMNMLSFLPASWIRPDDYFYLFLHFGLVFIMSFASLLGLVQIFMVRWRYKGGEWGKL
ncbi:hypothetical protein [Bradyrhizobium sp. HKCCYLS20291]|uniref:hypothetical protein n=1 Tax=Bradyrhizobium sp. HKCCYLS20291 TaxID=3420766 RepID=UPI003EBB2AC7